MADICRPLSPDAERQLLAAYAEIGYTGPKGPKVGGGAKKGTRRLRQRRQRQRRQRGGVVEYDTWLPGPLTEPLIESAKHVRQLGAGAFGSVSLFEYTDPKTERPVYYVEKKIQVTGPGVDSCNLKRLVRNEATILKELTENLKTVPYIIPCIGYKIPKDVVAPVPAVAAGAGAGGPPFALFIKAPSFDPTYASIYFPYIEGKDLFEFTSDLRQKSIDANENLFGQKNMNNLYAQIYNGLQAIHEAGIIHRDVKLENIYVDIRDPENNRFYLIDFGLAIRNDNKTLKSVGGTPGYLHPELVDALRDKRNIVYKPEYDFYALNVTLSNIFNVFNYFHQAAPAAAPAAAAPAAAAPAAAAPAGNTRKRKRSNEKPNASPKVGAAAVKHGRLARQPTVGEANNGSNNNGSNNNGSNNNGSNNNGSNNNSKAAKAAANAAFNTKTVEEYFQWKQKRNAAIAAAAAEKGK